MIRIALAKGRVSDSVLEILKGKGIEFGDEKDDRKLILHEPEGKYELILVKPQDTPTYVEQGVAECGIVGRDIVMEQDSDVYQLFSLEAAKCKLCLAGKPGGRLERYSNIKIATKYTSSAEAFLEQKGVGFELIKLNGSVELAPILGMSDAIIDIVETGNTLRANGLEIWEDICEIQCVFIANKAALKTRHKELSELISCLYEGKV
ncbi:MAG: ATP phosphoribosyltransferase [Eubacteriaceae bacterium]|nr:ATP phosphoribosyltransferase [Eubacteriaceae bacterium]